MVGVPGRSKGCNTCKQRKIAVGHILSLSATYSKPRFSAVLKSPNVGHVSSPVVFVRAIIEKEYLFWTIDLKAMVHEHTKSHQLMQAHALLQRREKTHHPRLDVHLQRL